MTAAGTSSTVPATPLLVVVGPTASGKTELALQAAERLGGEIVSADAFAVYRGLDIGTDKPDAAARRRVRHHLIDVVEPDQRCSAGDFVAAADAAIAEICDRGLQPIVAGGTHFWIRALLLGLFPAPRREAERTLRLGEDWARDASAVRARLEAVDPEAAARIAPADRQRTLRALEVFETTGEPLSAHWRRHRRDRRYDALLIAPKRDRAELRVRIVTRVETMFASGLVEEVRRLLAEGLARDAHAFKAIGYREVAAAIAGETDLETAIELTTRASLRLAKRQLTWLRHVEEAPLCWVAPAERGGTEELLGRWRDFARGEHGA